MKIEKQCSTWNIKISFRKNISLLPIILPSISLNFITDRNIPTKQLRRATHILLLLLLLQTASGTSFAQSKKYRHKPFLQGIELGFYGRSELGFSAHRPVQLRFTQPAIFIRLPLSSHLKAEVCINRERFFNSLNNNGNSMPLLKGLNNSHFSVPASIQYYFLNPSSKVRPFVGVGGWLFATSGNNTPYSQNEEARINKGYRGPNFISVFYTQGITIEVNTHLQVTQSIHIYHMGDVNNIEMSFGIGYRLP